MLRWLTAGESHGQQLTAILEGLPAGVQVQTSDIDLQLARRRLGHGRGARMSFEQDEVTLTGGVRHGRTQGGPIAVQVGNTEWPKWSTVMSADPVAPEVLAGQARNAPSPAPAPVTPTSRACRSTASTTPARCWSGPAPARRRRG
ncbi:chorismate synthase [Blastococcus brunescens]|uniref:chorismate synthase n=1 Tax=Blastococcus brunescens TaxID=1564165 RepID=A0ABZ1BAH4_9ACTN|nr:chorismate synthase [Blastococcus sp. BMG 8361]WRL66205.1 chorismate synthase [Blastococcus sp. BMG 8361]